MTVTLPAGSGDAAGAATLDEVARLAGVSRSTASRALNGGTASARSVAAVQAAAAQLGFVANRAARGLARQRTDAIALVIPEQPAFIFSDVFLAQVTTTVSAAAWRAGLQPLLVLMDPADPVATGARVLNPGNVDGMVIASYHHSPQMEDLLTSSRLPAVFIGKPPSADLFPYVDVDNYGGGHQATAHLVARGCRHLACLGGDLAMAAVADRRQGWLDACAEAGIAPGPFVGGAFTAESGLAETRQLLADYPEVDGVFAQSDGIAAGVLQALSAAGKRVPDDVAVVGFDNFAVATQTCPQLTTVTQPVTDLAGAAADLLLGYLKTGAWSDYPRTFPTTLVVRDSA
ncbi:MAG: LacI family transcriptional regulator [Propionibacteriaceae bacterium]|jgi:DNA-binding LacI/PurR family transcriptional regulator|nr:LacI family transcriptional regulator [Propionibacteriaceae bacterium]